MADTEIKARLAGIFREEAREHLQVILDSLSELDRGLPEAEAAAALEGLFRAMHTLKGAARSVGVEDVEACCQASESLLSEVTQGRRRFTGALLEQLHQAATEIARLLSRVAGPAPPIRPSPSPARDESIRLATGALDDLLVQTENLLAFKLAVEERTRQAAELANALTRCRKSIAGVDHTAPRGRGESAAEMHTVFHTAERQARSLQAALVADHRSFSTTMDALLDDGRRLRMAPASTILEGLPMMIRSLASGQGKTIDCTIRGADLPVDRRVLGLVKDALIHLVRNAIDHGIEAPDVRRRSGKSPAGTIAVSCAPLEGGHVAFCVDDDGRGVDLEQVRMAAARGRLLTAEEIAALPDDEVLDLIYRSGLSTSPVVTDLSGHGLGMAVVKERTERLGGQVHANTRPGAGLRVRIVVPTTIATFHGLLVKEANQLFLLPLASVEQVVRVAADDVGRVEGRETISWKGAPVSAARLAEILLLTRNGWSAPDAEDPAGRPLLSGRGGSAGGRGRRPAVIVRSEEGRLALLIDEVIGNREVLVKEIRPPVGRMHDVAGAGLLGTGEMALILRPADLVGSLRTPPGASTAPDPSPGAARPSVVLVVDDSITTRTMEKNLLEASGYRTLTAVDGAEAWTLVKTEPVDLVLSDVDMPRMNGFELTTRIRGDKDLAELPIILVTALESREDKERGVRAGANAYVVKSGFEQSTLLELIRRFL